MYKINVVARGVECIGVEHGRADPQVTQDEKPLGPPTPLHRTPCSRYFWSIRRRAWWGGCINARPPHHPRTIVVRNVAFPVAMVPPNVFRSVSLSGPPPPSTTDTPSEFHPLGVYNTKRGIPPKSLAKISPRKNKIISTAKKSKIS